MLITKVRYPIFVFGCFILLLGLLFVGRSNAADTAQSGLRFIAEAEKDRFVLGEPVSVTFRVTNDSGEPNEIAGGGVDEGSLKIFVRKENESEYKEFFATDWGRIRQTVVKLEPERTHSYPAVTILYSGILKPMENLSEAVRKDILTNVTTVYVFEEPGVYYIRGEMKKLGDTNILTSQPARIKVGVPEGEDAVVWARMKADPTIGRFIQTGDALGDKFVQDLEMLIVDAPNSRIAPILRKKIDDFRAGEKRRNELYKQFPDSLISDSASMPDSFLKRTL